jgi:branched-chain amino acid transport system substrate-binding protein
LNIFALLVAILLLAACGGTGGETPTEPPAGTEPPAATETTAPTEAALCAPGTYKIAYQGPISGDNAALGENMIRGIELAIQQANAGELVLPSGNSLGEGVEVVLEQLDSQGLPDQAPALAQGAVADAAVLAVNGPAFSGETAASAPVYDGAGLVMVSPSATNPDLTASGWTHFFRTVATDAAQGPVAATFITENLGAQNVAVIDDSSEYGKGLADLVEQSLKDLGAKIAERQGVEAGQQDYGALVGQVAQSGAEAVFFGGYFPEAGLIRRQLVDAGAGDAPFVSDDGSFDDQFIETAGADAAEGSYVTYPGANPQEADPEFITAFEELSGGEGPGAFSIEAYQNTQIIVDAIATVGCDRTAIRDHVANFSGTVFGDKDISFDENGDIATQNYNVFKVVGGEWTFEAEVAPAAG